MEYYLCYYCVKRNASLSYSVEMRATDCLYTRKRAKHFSRVQFAAHFGVCNSKVSENTIFIEIHNNALAFFLIREWL